MVKQKTKNFTRIYLIRHGETSWNQELRYQGQSNPELNATGKKQAAALAKTLSEVKFDICYSSDLKRACQTALELIKCRNISIKKIRGLREINYGKWEGLRLDEVRARFMDSLEHWWEKPASARIPGGETLKAFTSRVLLAFLSIIKNHHGKTIAIITHGGPIRVMVGYALGLPFHASRALTLDNASCTLLEVRGSRFVLRLFNDTCHLRDRDRRVKKRK